MDRVLLTVELLEYILLKVDDVHSILTSCSRVCRLWKYVIRDSPRLQKLLFFRPDTTSAARGPLQITPRMNTLLLCHFGGLLTSAPDETLRSVYPPAHDGLLGFRASWRGMLTQQPPAKKLGMWTIESGGSFEQGFKITIQNLELGDETGILIGMLAEFVDNLGQGSPWTLFWGIEGMRRLRKDKNSLFVRKARLSERVSLFKMWEESDIVVKFTRWTGAK